MIVPAPMEPAEFAGYGPQKKKYRKHDSDHGWYKNWGPQPTEQELRQPMMTRSGKTAGINLAQSVTQLNGGTVYGSFYTVTESDGELEVTNPIAMVPAVRLAAVICARKVKPLDGGATTQVVPHVASAGCYFLFAAFAAYLRQNQAEDSPVANLIVDHSDSE